jgi:hypothetical protein
MQTYSHSGRIPITGAIATLLAGLVAAAVCGMVYAYAFYYVPFLILNLLFTLLFAGAIGLMTGIGSAGGKVRNNLFVSAAAVFCTLVGLYVYWGAYMWVLAGIGNVGLNAFNPRALASFAAWLFQNGSWGLSEGSPVTGWPLVAVWIIEAGATLFISVSASRLGADRPFCESCNEWTDQHAGVARLAANATEPAWQEVLAGDLPALAAFEPAHPADSVYVRLDVARCPRCEQSRFLTINSIATTTDSKGNTSENVQPLIANAILTPMQFAVVEACGQLYQQRLQQWTAECDELDALDELADNEQDMETSKEEANNRQTSAAGDRPPPTGAT